MGARRLPHDSPGVAAPLVVHPSRGWLFPRRIPLRQMLLPGDEEHWLDPDLTDPRENVSLLRRYPADLLVARPAT